MQQEHIKEWQRLQATALTTLRDGRHDQGICLLYLLVMPSWEPFTNYEIYATPARHLSASHIVVVTRWRGDIDVAKFDTPVQRLKHSHTLTPTFETQSFETTTEFVDGILNKFTAISIPTRTNTDVWGLDGTSYEVGVGNGFVWSCFRWHEEPPPEWQSLGVLFHDTLRELEKTTTVRSRVDAG